MFLSLSNPSPRCDARERIRSLGKRLLNVWERMHVHPSWAPTWVLAAEVRDVAGLPEDELQPVFGDILALVLEGVDQTPRMNDQEPLLGPILGRKKSRRTDCRCFTAA
jgi:hypothetical protein